MLNQPKRTRWLMCVALVLPLACNSRAPPAPTLVQITSVPQHGRLPDAKIDSDGRLHLVYLSGKNLYYTTSTDMGAAFDTPVRVNDRVEFAAGALFRGPKLAVTMDGIAHIVWYNRGYELGLDRSEWGVMYSTVRRGELPAPAQYAFRGGADGYSITTDGANILVGWHDDSAVFLARRAKSAMAFERPVALKSLPCECCDTALSLQSLDSAWAVYRDREGNRRDMFIHAINLKSGNQRRQRLDIQSWVMEACPISGTGFAVDGAQALVAWEHDGSILAAVVTLPALTATPPIRIGSGKYPIALIGSASMLIGWKEGKRLHWSVLDRQSLKAIEQGTADSDNYDRATGVATANGHYLLFQ